MECCLYSLSRNIISPTFTFVIFSWTIHVVLFAHFTRLSQNLLSIFFPLNSTAENDKMIEIELTTSLFQITFNRTAVWRRRYYLPSAVSFRSSSPAFVWFVLPSSNPGVYSQPLTLWLRTDDYPVLKISFLLTRVNFFFFFQKNFTAQRLRWIAFFKSSWEKTKSARWGVKRPCYWNSPLFLCFVCSLCCIISISRSEMELNSTDGQESIAFEIDKRNTNVCYIFCLVFLLQLWLEFPYAFLLLFWNDK
jgi:hypothetical protein